MADIKITDLTALSSASANDVLPIVDVETNTTKKITKSDFLKDGYADGSIPGSALTNYSVPATKLNGVWWEEIGRTIVSSPVNNIAVQFSPRRYLHVIINCGLTAAGNGAIMEECIRFNDDSSASYTQTQMFVQPSSTTFNVQYVQSDTKIDLNVSPQSFDSISTQIWITDNPVSNLKQIHLISSYSGNNPNAVDVPFQNWAHWGKSDPTITKISLFDFGNGGNRYGAGSEMIVLGHD